MKTIFDAAAREGLIARIAGLDGDGQALWGKMNAYQMVKHCIIFDEWVLGENAPKYKLSFLGRIFGKAALKSTLKDEGPMKRNVPTLAEFKVREKQGDMELVKAKWIGLLPKYGHFSNPAFIHDFFGRMTEEQIGFLAYKHADHHLRQFGC
jgi:hypothetical protein